MELFVSIVTASLNLLLGLFTFLKNPHSSTNKLFAFLTFQISLWAISNYFSLHSDTASMTLFWIRMVMLITSPMGPTIFLLFNSFPHSQINIKKKYLLGIFFLVLFCSILSISPYMFVSIDMSSGNISPVPGFGILVYEITAIGFLILAAIAIFKKYRKARDLEKLQLKYLIFGISVTFSLIVVTNFIFVVLLQISNFVIFGPLFTLILVGFIAYAIIKHRLLNIGLLVARSVAFFILISIVFTIYIFVMFGISGLFFDVELEKNQLILYAILTLIISLTFNPLRRYTEKATDKIFFKNNYSANDLLSKLTKILATNLKLRDISVKTLDELFRTMHVSRGAFYILNRDNKIKQLVSGGFAGEKIGNNDVILGLCKEKKILILDEEKNQKNKEIMTSLRASIILPLYSRKKMAGVLLLGEKKSGDIYFNKDIDVLKIFGPEVSVALENAKAYEEIGRFNTRLKEEVNHATKNLQDANERLKQLDKLKDEFVSLASHELRTPMTVIKSYLWMMLDKNHAQNLSEKQKTYLDRAYVSTQRLINLVNDMLNVSRIESGRFTLAMQKISLDSLIGNVYSEMLPKASELGIKLEFARPLHPLVKVNADPERVEQVLINLIGNSLKFTPRDGTIRVSIEYDEKEKREIVSVKDTGKGISKDDILKLFQKFSMVGENYMVRQNTQGTGLGLYLSKAIVELMGGKIWVESEGEGKGTKFSFDLKTV